ncbi:MAG: HAMP domain-containing histidine kinase [Rhodospirillales bacterium]|nr:HAMP domain-containing histidine kinase [Rhodospirillales bacterium]
MANNHAQIYELLRTAETEVEEGIFYDNGRPYIAEIHDIEALLRDELSNGTVSSRDADRFNTLVKQTESYRLNTTNAMLLATVDLSLSKNVMANSTKQYNEVNSHILQIVQSIQRRLDQELLAHKARTDGKNNLFILLFAATISLTLILSYVFANLLSHDLRRLISQLKELVSHQSQLENLQLPSENEVTTLETAIGIVGKNYEYLEQTRAELDRSNQQLSKSNAIIMDRETSLASLNKSLEQKITEQQTMIAERQRTETALAKALGDAETANQSKSKFLATMSHEFRTPLNAILGFSEMLRMQYFGPLGCETYKDYANDIHYSGELMLDMVNDVLDISTIEAGKRQLSPETFDMEELLGECVRKVDNQATDKNINLSLQVALHLPPVRADKRSVTQVILNLLSNAVKFTNPGGKIELQAEMENHQIVLAVQDNGIGIPAGQLASITEAFVQVNSNPHTATEGTGLGLSIVKSLVESNGGTLAIESELDKGTRVTVRIPISAESAMSTER